jgi:hypothetical protein
LLSFYASIAFTGQYAAHNLQSTQEEVITAFPLTSMAANLQKATHWPHPTQFSFTFMVFTGFYCIRISTIKSLVVLCSPLFLCGMISMMAYFE